MVACYDCSDFDGENSSTGCSTCMRTPAPVFVNSHRCLLARRACNKVIRNPNIKYIRILHIQLRYLSPSTFGILSKHPRLATVRRAGCRIRDQSVFAY
eukprot:1057390-Prorocentrum_minimum.AAC.4